MQRLITGFHQDEAGDWVAELDCFHNQHTRHKPPFFNRPWVETQAGRQSMLGTQLDCVRCDALEFPDGVVEYKRTPVFTQDSIPAGLLKDHNTKAGVWGLILVEEGALLYTVLEPAERSMLIQAGERGVVVPLMKHKVQAQGNVRFCVAFHRREASQAPAEPVQFQPL
jgi:tellurite methyltransferase